jgi:hypothetical protein
VLTEAGARSLAQEAFGEKGSKDVSMIVRPIEVHDRKSLCFYPATIPNNVKAGTGLKSHTVALE